MQILRRTKFLREASLICNAAPWSVYTRLYLNDFVTLVVFEIKRVEGNSAITSIVKSIGKAWLNKTRSLKCPLRTLGTTLLAPVEKL